MDNGHIIILGYGDVSKSVVEVLQDEKINFVVIEKNESLFENVKFEYIIGDGTDENVLQAAKIEDAFAMIVALNNDDHVIFSIIVAYSLNPDLITFARANSVKSIDKIYRAGANYVGALSIVSGQILARIALDCAVGACQVKETIMLYEGIEIEKYDVMENSFMAGKTMEELDLLNLTGCKIIGFQRGDFVETSINSKTKFEVGDIIAVAGNTAKIELFREKYTRNMLLK